MKQVIRLTENDLHTIIENSVRRIMNETMSQREYQHRAGEKSRKAHLAKGEDPIESSKSNVWDNYAHKRREQDRKKYGDDEGHDEQMFDDYISGLNGEPFNGGRKGRINQYTNKSYNKD